VAALKRQELIAAGQPPTLLKKRIECNGQVTEANLYFEEDAHLFDAALASRSWD